MRNVILACAAAVFCAAVAVLPAQDQPAKRKTVRDPAYSAAQAERGKKVYDENCVTCHLPDLDGSDNATRGGRGAPRGGDRERHVPASSPAGRLHRPPRRPS